MKLYNHSQAPNPRRVRVFAAEKGIELALEEIDILAGQSRTPEFLAKNSSGAVPLLELDDGSYLSKSVAISPVSGRASSWNRTFLGATSVNRRRSRGGTDGWKLNCWLRLDALFKIPVRSFEDVSSNSRNLGKRSERWLVSVSNGWIAN